MSEGLKHKIRRNLSRWSRKLLICIGLESIGSELVGERNWRHLYPLNSDWERNKKNSPVSDFDPSGPTSFRHNAHDCFPDLPHLDPTLPNTDDDEEEDEEHAEDGHGTYDNLAQLLPYWYFINRAFGAQSASSLGVHHGNISEDLNVRTDRNPNPFADALDAQQLNALFLLHSFKQQQEQQQVVQLQLQTGYSGTPLMRVSNLQEFRDPNELVRSIRRAQRPRPQFHSSYSAPATPNTQDLEDEPLDLTYKSKTHLSEKSLGKSSQLLPPEVSSSNNERNVTALDKYSKVSIKSSPRANRGYTTQELEAALNDIQSGKLGTRRAAVIYGIPRSTLRNKVYKLGKDRNHAYRLKNKTGVLDRRDRAIQPNCGKDTELSLPLSTGSAFSPVSKVGLQGLPAGTDGSGDEVKSEEEVSREKKALKEWLHSKLSRQRLIAEEVADGIEFLGNGTCSGALRNTNGTSSPGCSDEETQDYDRSLLSGTPLSHDARSTGSRRLKRRHSCGDEQFSHLSRAAHFSNSGTIANSPRGTEDSDWSRRKVSVDEDYCMDESDRTKVDKGNGDLYLDLESGNLSDGDGNGKKSRPKRGKYRNYDRDALVRAVKAVQNGEMSVHRAGSHFGVPHSTLEYKVKERHLLRRPTRRGSLQPNGTAKLSSQKSSPDSSLSGSESGLIRPGTPLHLEYSPVASTTRETLTRFLNVATSAAMRRRSRGSVDSSSRAPSHIPKEPNSRDSPSPTQLNDLLRQNMDNSSLLNMMKKV